MCPCWIHGPDGSQMLTGDFSRGHRPASQSLGAPGSGGQQFVSFRHVLFKLANAYLPVGLQAMVGSSSLGPPVGGLPTGRPSPQLLGWTGRLCFRTPISGISLGQGGQDGHCHHSWALAFVWGVAWASSHILNKGCPGPRCAQA